jgi:hypothetical protein
METKVCGPKGGLLVQGIEIRPKKGLLASSSAMSKSKHQAGGEEQAATTTSTVACEIVRLPQELLMKVLSHITPQDAARAAAVSQAFRAILDSDAFWTRFVTSVHNLLLFHYNGQTLSQKEMFLCLSDRPILSVTRRMVWSSPTMEIRACFLFDALLLLIDCCVQSMWLDRQTGAKCYMLSARALNIAWSRKPQHWRWIIHCTDRRFASVFPLR